MAKVKDELAALKAQQAADEAREREKAERARRIAELEMTSRQDEAAEREAARRAEKEAAAAVLAQAERDAMPALLELQKKLDAVNAAAGAVGGLNNRLSGLAGALNDTLATIKRVYPDLLDLPPTRVTRQEQEKAASRARIDWLRDKAGQARAAGDEYLMKVYRRALEAERTRLAVLEGREPEPEQAPELSVADIAFMRQTGINPARLRNKAAGGDE